MYISEEEYNHLIQLQEILQNVLESVSKIKQTLGYLQTLSKIENNLLNGDNNVKEKS